MQSRKMLELQNRVVIVLLLTVALTSGEIRNRGWWNHTVFYQIYPRSFMDDNNDGVGDLRGITSRLEYLVNSGVGAIWLSPIYKSPMIDFGYDISDFRDIDEIFGTLSDFEKLVARAKKLGLKVILDLVPNHTSDKHHWFQLSIKGTGKYKDYYVWADGKYEDALPPNNWLSVFSGSAWTYNEIRRQWYFHQFEYRQPDLNYSNPEVQEEMKRIIIYWLDKGVDGFRVDAIPHLTENNYTLDEPKSGNEGVSVRDHDSLKHIYTMDQQQTYEIVKSWRKLLDDYADIHNTDEKIMMTEAYTTLENTLKYYEYGAHFPFNFKFITDVDAGSSATEFKNVIDNWMNKKPDNAVPNWVMGNHDRNRTASRFPGRNDQMTMLAMTLPGVAVTYYGEEIGMVDKMDISWEDTQDPQGCNAGPEHYKSRSRDPVRTPFQWNQNINAGFNKGHKTWLPVHGDYLTTNVDLQRAIENSHYNIYRQLTQLRNTSDALKFGSLTTDVLNNQTVLLVLRKVEKEAVSLLINFSDKVSQTINLAETLKEYGKSTIEIASVGSDIKRNQSVDLDKIGLPAQSSIIVISQAGSNAARYNIASLQIILLSMLFLIMMLYK